MVQIVENNNQLAIIQNSIELFKTAPQILQANKERTEKALAVGNNILTQWQNAWAIEDEEARINALMAVDERSNKFLVNCGTALKEEKEARTAITQMMDQFKKMFTSAENDIDKANPNTVPNKVQNNRDTYAMELHKINERKRLEAERVAAKAKEAIELKTAVELRLNNYFNDRLLKAKQWLQKCFNDLQFENFADNAAELRMYTPQYSIQHYNEFEPSLYATYHNADEIKAIVLSVTQTGYATLNDKYVAEMTALKTELVEKIPSKHQEILEQKRLTDEVAAAEAAAKKAEQERQAAIAAANEEEKKKIEEEATKARAIEAAKQEELRKQQAAAAEEQQKREAAEAARLQAEADEAKKKAEFELEAKKQGEQTMVMFETEATMAEAPTSGKTKAGYEIEILHQAAYVQIFQLWFENEGKTLTIDKIGNTKLEQMKTWAEKQATKNNTKIESKLLRYKETVKAVNTK